MSAPSRITVSGTETPASPTAQTPRNSAAKLATGCPLTASTMSPTLRLRLFRRPFRGEARDHQIVVRLRDVGAEPGPRGAARPARGPHVVQDRLQQVDGDDHVAVERIVAAGARVLDQQRADPHEPAMAVDQPASAPTGMRGAVKSASSSTYSQ